jgi:O-antigen biosynthesis protein
LHQLLNYYFVMAHSVSIPSDQTPSHQSLWPPIAVRTIELTQPLGALDGLENYAGVRIFPTWQQIPVGCVEINHQFQATVGIDQLGQALAQLAWDTPTLLPMLDPAISVSIVIGTCDRPNTLRRCLQSLLAQQTSRTVEIVVVDNRPQSGLTAPILAEFPQVKSVIEARSGLAYARNAGILASSGDLIVATDDDVVAAPEWLERLVAPFARPEVMAVTGNVLPLELETQSQQLFEIYGGLSRGFQTFEADQEWFCQSEPLRPWLIGVTANAAFRAQIFRQPDIGLMDEALGAGMPSGGGEDGYLLYKILKAQGVIVYEPAACVWHQHRRQMSELQQQIYAYAKSEVAYHLTTLLRDRDFRTMKFFRSALLIDLTRPFTWPFTDRRYPLRFIGWEILGKITGAWALWRSRQRVRQWGYSGAMRFQK